MKKSYDHFTSSDILQSVLKRVPKIDCKNVRLVNKKWHDVATINIPKLELASEFHISLKTIASLTSPNLVYQRLSRICKRGKCYFLNDEKVYRLYCASGTINEDFIHLLDNNKKWFDSYFDHRDQFFLESNFKYACIVGNLDLVKYLIDIKGCIPRADHAHAAAASGELDLVQYLLEEKNCSIIRKPGHSIFSKAIMSNNVDVLIYIIKKYKLEPEFADFKTAVHCGADKIVNYLHKTYQFTAEDIDCKKKPRQKISIVKCIKRSRNLDLIKFLIEELKPDPESAEKLNNAAYSTGMLDIVKYIEKKVPFEINSTVEARSKAFKKAISSGDLATFKHVLDKLAITPTNFNKKTADDEQYILSLAVKSSSLDIVKFLVNECDFKLTCKTNNDLLLDAVRTQSISLVRYLLEEHRFTLTDNIFNCIENVEMLSMLYNLCEKNKPLNVSRLFNRSSLLMLGYQLLSKEEYKANENILDTAFQGYQWEWRENRKNIWRLFLHYLMDKHQLKPTETMISTMMNEKCDPEMRALLRNKIEEGNKTKDAPDKEEQYHSTTSYRL